jgi:long-chain acyl-CoA synthetase
VWKDPSLNENTVHVSYLPMAHSFEEAVFTAMMIIGGSAGFYSGDPNKLLDDLKVLRPTLFVSVPRLFSRIYDKVLAGAKEKTPF